MSATRGRFIAIVVSTYTVSMYVMSVTRPAEGCHYSTLGVAGTRHHCTLNNTKLQCLMTEAGECQKIALFAQQCID